ncbi:MAG: AAA family ATPase [Dehalococcoidia bacterium]|nr:AAA family ATPase [Dehalococcoidia bacterium]
MHISSVTLHPERYPVLDSYPFNLNIFQRSKNIDFTSPVTFFVGENGTGKSTLLRAICLKCGIHIWENLEGVRYEYNPYESSFHEYIEIKWTDGPVKGSYFSSQIFQDFARYLDQWAHADPGMLDYFGGESLLTQSHGQSLISFFTARYSIEGIYFLDEPETALSPKSQLQLLKLLKEMIKDDHAQFIITSHSPILLAFPGAVLYNFDADYIEAIDYEKTDYFRIYRDFMNNKDSYINNL